MASRFTPALIICLGVAIALPLSAHDDEGKTKEQKARDHHFHELGDAFKAIRDQNKAPSMDFAVVKKNAKVVSDASVGQEKWFAKGTGPETGKTDALPEIWSKPEDFKAAQKMFADAAPKLLAAANASDAAAVKTAFGDVGKACKNCHESFRKPEEH
jgi:cytochrome c556